MTAFREKRAPDYRGTRRVLALASKRVVVQVERVVSAAEIAAHAPGTTLPAFLVSAVVLAPGGCRPTAFPREYERDGSELRAYLDAARTPEGLDSYLSALEPR
jgi:hypothetical protein